MLPRVSTLSYSLFPASALVRCVLASSAGIIVSFLALAGLAVGLKAAGLAVGWGIQFQQPLFLSALAVVMALFACNLLGFFAVPLPGFVGRWAARGSGESDHHSLWGRFADRKSTRLNSSH